MSNKLYGVPIDKKLIDQLNYRKENLLHKSKNVAELMIDNNRGAYVSLVSGATEVFYKNEETKVSTQRYPDLKDNEKAQLSNRLAQGNVLFGGTLYTEQTSNASSADYSYFNLKKRGGISFNTGFDELGNKSSYDFSSTYGYRPMMGITNLAVNYKTAMGAIREATINIAANSPEQLSILDKLYFRPGYTMLLEWGNNLYIDGYGLMSSFYQTFARDFLQFDADLSKIKEDITLYRNDTGYNYDGMIGKVTNFDWKYTATGVYDCSLKIVSEGDLIEGIKTTYSKPKNYFTDKYNGKGQNTGGDTYDDKFLEILAAFKNDSKQSSYLADLKKDGVDIPAVYKTTYDKGSETNTPNATAQRGHAMYHITLQDLLKLINKYILEDEDTGSTKLSFNTDPESSRMVTFVGHISGNPKTCVMPYRSGNAGGFENTPSELNLYLVNKKEQLLNVIRKSPDNQTAPDDSPLKILISIDQIEAIQRRLVEQEAQDKTKEAKVAKFMNTLLDNISRDLGGINKFKLLYDKDTTSHIIVDENIPSATDEGDFEMPEIDVVGLGSFCTNVSIESKISPNITNTLAIAATAQGTSLNDSITPLLKYNKGVTDRFDIDNVVENDDEKKDKRHPVKAKLEDTQDEAAGALGKAYRRIKQGIYSDQLFASTIIPHRRLTSALYDYIQLRRRGEGKKVPYTNLIPIDLTLEFRGITGFKNGEAFTISPEVLPERYRGKVGFVIKGIDHKIDSNNMWTTGVTSNMIMLPSDEPVALPDDFNELKKIPVKDLIEAINYDPPQDKTAFPVPASKKWPWSAAFMSYCMQTGDSSFPGSASHTGYLEKVRKGHTDRYEILNADEHKPQLGDLIIKGRSQSGYLNFSKVPYSGQSHGDIVVKITDSQLICIGGNVNQSVRQTEVNLTSPGRAGFLKDKRGGKGSATVKRDDGTLTFANQYTTIIRAKSSAINVGLIIANTWKEWKTWAKTVDGVKSTTERDEESKANDRDERGEELFQRMKAYWAAAGYNNFERNPGY